LSAVCNQQTLLSAMRLGRD